MKSSPVVRATAVVALEDGVNVIVELLTSASIPCTNAVITPVLAATAMLAVY